MVGRKPIHTANRIFFRLYARYSYFIKAALLVAVQAIAELKEIAQLALNNTANLFLEQGNKISQINALDSVQACRDYLNNQLNTGW